MTTKELTDIVVANTLAIAETNKTQSQNALTIAEINKTLAQLTHNIHETYESIKMLETVAETLVENVSKHDEVIANLEKQWQAYINTLPKT